MKKKIIIIATIIIILGIGAFLALKYHNKKEADKYNDKLSELITKNNWERAGGGDTERIYFSEDGSYGYYCLCGNPVGNSDLYDSYVYDKETNTIKLINSYGGKSELIKIKEVSELKLVLDFDGKEKTFYSIEGMYLKDNPLPIASIEYKTSEDVRIEFKKDGTFESYDNKKGGYTYSSDICFTWTYDEEYETIYLECNDEVERKIMLHKYDESNIETSPITLLIFNSETAVEFEPIK